MPPMKHEIFGGEVVLHIRNRVTGTDKLAQDMVDAWQAMKLFEEADHATMVTTAWLLVSVVKTEFGEQLGVEAQYFQEFLKWFEECVVVQRRHDGTLYQITTDLDALKELLERMEFDVGVKIRVQWIDGWTRAQGAYKAPPKHVHPSMLTEAQVLDPNSQPPVPLKEE